LQPLVQLEASIGMFHCLHAGVHLDAKNLYLAATLSLTQLTEKGRLCTATSFKQQTDCHC
jgi:hypothetical protein